MHNSNQACRAFSKLSIKLLLVLVIFFSCNSKESDGTSICDNEYFANAIVKHKVFDNASVASAHHLASEIGMEVMKRGGNAIDAAIAVQFALAVCYPIAGNIGGGGFMIYRTNDGHVTTLDFRETAPALSTQNMFLDEQGEVIEGKSLYGVHASGVPGSVDGMWRAFQEYSKLKNWKSLLQPAIDLASNGFVISSKQARRLNEYRDAFLDNNSGKIPFVKEDIWQACDTLKQLELAQTLERIAEYGRDGFYQMETADFIIEQIKKDRGLMRHADLASYNAIWRKPINSKYKDYNIISMAPPSSGGIALIQLFNAVEKYPIREWGFHSKELIHLMVEAERRVYADRATHLGDPEFFDVPLQELMEKNYMDKRMSDFDMGSASPSDQISAGNPRESEETTHFSIVDADGNAVSLTTTINTAYGSKVYVQGAGFFLNNEMDDFSVKAGVPNYFGLVGSEANAIEPNKRMLSSMSPTIVEKNDKLFMVVGSPGGSTIITSVFQTILNVIEFDMGAKEATHACRFHHQWLPDEIMIEDSCLAQKSLDELSSMGHKIRVRNPIGKVETILRLDDGRLESAADIRGEDSVSGY